MRRRTGAALAGALSVGLGFERHVGTTFRRALQKRLGRLLWPCSVLGGQRLRAGLGRERCGDGGPMDDISLTSIAFGTRTPMFSIRPAAASCLAVEYRYPSGTYRCL